MTNAMTKKQYETYKNRTYHVIEFFHKDGEGWIRGTHTSGADLPRALQIVMRVTGTGGRVIVCNGNVYARAISIDPNRSPRTDAARTLYRFEYEPIKELIEKAYAEVKTEQGFRGVR